MTPDRGHDATPVSVDRSRFRERSFYKHPQPSPCPYRIPSVTEPGKLFLESCMESVISLYLIRATLERNSTQKKDIISRSFEILDGFNMPVSSTVCENLTFSREHHYYALGSLSFSFLFFFFTNFSMRAIKLVSSCIG